MVHPTRGRRGERGGCHSAHADHERLRHHTPHKRQPEDIHTRLLFILHSHRREPQKSTLIHQGLP